MLYNPRGTLALQHMGMMPTGAEHTVIQKASL